MRPFLYLPYRHYPKRTNSQIIKVKGCCAYRLTFAGSHPTNTQQITVTLLYLSYRMLAKIGPEKFNAGVLINWCGADKVATFFRLF